MQERQNGCSDWSQFHRLPAVSSARWAGKKKFKFNEIQLRRHPNGQVKLNNQSQQQSKRGTRRRRRRRSIGLPRGGSRVSMPVPSRAVDTGWFMRLSVRHGSRTDRPPPPAPTSTTSATTTNAALKLTKFKSPMFSLLEPPGSSSEGASLEKDDEAPRCIDLAKTFCPAPHLPCIGAKLFICAWMLSTLTLSIRQDDHPSFWPAYLTNWGLLLTVLYAIMSLASAVYFAVHPVASPGMLQGRRTKAGTLVKSTWTLFATALPAEIMITILYWVLEFDGTVGYVSVLVHGGFAIVIAIDGFLLSRIPLRMRQCVFIEAFAVLYTLWSVVHAYSGIGNHTKMVETGTTTPYTNHWRGRRVLLGPQ